jgi:hypothetical protein
MVVSSRIVEVNWGVIGPDRTAGDHQTDIGRCSGTLAAFDVTEGEAGSLQGS